MPSNLVTYLDLIEAEDPCVIIARQARHLDLPRVLETVRMASVGLAHGMALNHLGPGEPTDAAVAVMQAYLGFFEALIEEWQSGQLTRAQVEAAVSDTLPQIAAAAGRIDPAL